MALVRVNEQGRRIGETHRNARHSDADVERAIAAYEVLLDIPRGMSQNTAMASRLMPPPRRNREPEKEHIMIKITAQAAAQNFATLAALLIATAPSQKAEDFAQRTIARIEAMGADWMAKNAVELQILSPYWEPEVDAAQGVPVGDNRAYFMAQFQTVLARG